MKSTKIIIYSLFCFLALALSSGGVIAAFSDAIPQLGPIILLCALPPACLMLIAAYVNYNTLIPKYFLSRRYIFYLSICLVAAMSIPISGIAMEACLRNWLGLPDRIQNFLSPWILVDSLSTAALLIVIMIGMGVVRVYDEWRREVDVENSTAQEYDRAVENMKRSVQPDEVLASLESIRELVGVNAESANAELRRLSDRLRHDLYDIPKVKISTCRSNTYKFSLLSDFISSPKFTLLRDISLKILIACISITAIFDAPDRPQFTASGFMAFFGMFIALNLLTYGNKSLSKHFLNKGKIGKYIVGAFIFLAGMTVLIIAIEVFSYVHTIHNTILPPLYSIIATISSFCTITLYFGGITALIILHNWLRTVRSVAILKAETSGAELAFLQSQINPHFLFNVLNNAGILIYEDSAYAIEMLGRLSEMFAYQSKITRQDKITIGEEYDFIRNYLLLEQSRKSPFNFSIKIAEGLQRTEIPTLLLIPFVENASKHSIGSRDIRVSISTENDNLIFKCDNLCGDKKYSTASGGLGINNTRSRLMLIYGDKFHLSTTKYNSEYKVKLQIPLL